MLTDPAAPGRDFVLHATDETVTEFAIEPYAADAPIHVAAMRTPDAKFALYSHWPEEGIEPLTAGEEAELYDYSTHRGRLEVENVADRSALEAPLREQFQKAFVHELRRPLPDRLKAAHGRGFADYFATARRSVAAATARRRARVESTLGNVAQGQGGPAPHEVPAGARHGGPGHGREPHR